MLKNSDLYKVVKIKYNSRITQLLVHTLIVFLSINPVVADYEWYVFQLNSDASNPVWSYNGTIANGTVNNGVQHLQY